MSSTTGPVRPLRAGRAAPVRGTPAARHSYATIGLHWLSVMAIFVAAVSGLWREWSENDALRIWLLEVHKQSGLLVLACLFLRLAVRFTFGMADHAGELSPLMRAAASMSHAGLYLLLLALPSIGLLLCSASALDVRVFGIFSLPPLLEDDPDVAANLAQFHVWGAWALLAMVLMHVAAALWHHLVRRDGVMLAMLPLLRRREPVASGMASPEVADLQTARQRRAA